MGQQEEFLTRVRVPDAGRKILAGRQDTAAIPIPPGLGDPGIVGQVEQLFTAGGIPDAGNTIPIGRQDTALVPAPPGQYHPGLVGQPEQFLSTPGIPHPHRAVVAGREDPALIPVPGCLLDKIVMGKDLKGVHRRSHGLVQGRACRGCFVYPQRFDGQQQGQIIAGEIELSVRLGGQLAGQGKPGLGLSALLFCFSALFLCFGAVPFCDGRTLCGNGLFLVLTRLCPKANGGRSGDQSQDQHPHQHQGPFSQTGRRSCLLLRPLICLAPGFLFRFLACLRFCRSLLGQLQLALALFLFQAGLAIPEVYTGSHVGLLLLVQGQSPGPHVNLDLFQAAAPVDQHVIALLFWALLPLPRCLPDPLPQAEKVAVLIQPLP